MDKDKVKWDDSLSVGIQLIDEQHQSLIQKLNDVTTAIDQFQGPREVANTCRPMITPGWLSIWINTANLKPL